MKNVSRNHPSLIQLSALDNPSGEHDRKSANFVWRCKRSAYDILRILGSSTTVVVFLIDMAGRHNKFLVSSLKLL
jgi:hypothetical protein